MIWLRQPKLLLDKLEIDYIHTLVGPSMGGMHALALLVQNSNLVKNFIAISTARQSLPYSIAIRSLQREVIRKDPLWKNGYYSHENPPLNGVRIARKLGMLSYRSADEWAQRFGRKKSSKAEITQNTFGIENTGFEFEIESYLEHLAIKFQDVFDANSYLYLSRAIDWFDLIDYGSSPDKVLGNTTLTNALVLGVKTDTLFPISQQKELAECLSSGSTKVIYKSLDCIQGHDSFLVDIEIFTKEIKCFLENI
jgi:homoserine O-acetyltransferase